MVGGLRSECAECRRRSTSMKRINNIDEMLYANKAKFISLPCCQSQLFERLQPESLQARNAAVKLVTGWTLRVNRMPYYTLWVQTALCVPPGGFNAAVAGQHAQWGDRAQGPANPSGLRQVFPPLDDLLRKLSII